MNPARPDHHRTLHVTRRFFGWGRQRIGGETVEYYGALGTEIKTAMTQADKTSKLRYVSGLPVKAGMAHYYYYYYFY